MRAVRVLLTLSTCCISMAAFGCSSSGGGTTPPDSDAGPDDVGVDIEDASQDASVGEAVWQPTTVPYDPSCETGCETLIVGNFGHVGELEVVYNPDVDDAVAQWADCLESFQTCLIASRDGQACSEASACPPSCRSDYESRIAGVSDLEAQHAAFLDVYVHDGAPCLPVEEVTP